MLDKKTQEKILNWNVNYSKYSMLSDPKLYKKIVEELAEPYKNDSIDKVLGIEARGFILGAPVAYILGSGFIVCRKKGNMYVDENKYGVIEDVAIDYSGKKKILQIEKHPKAIQKGEKVLVVDDWFETGSQGQTAIKLIELASGIVAGVSIMIDDMDVSTREKFSKYKLNSLVIKENFKNIKLTG